MNAYADPSMLINDPEIQGALAARNKTNPCRLELFSGDPKQRAANAILKVLTLKLIEADASEECVNGLSVTLEHSADEDDKYNLHIHYTAPKNILVRWYFDKFSCKETNQGRVDSSRNPVTTYDIRASADTVEELMKIANNFSDSAIDIDKVMNPPWLPKEERYHGGIY